MHIVVYIKYANTLFIYQKKNVTKPTKIKLSALNSLDQIMILTKKV